MFNILKNIFHIVDRSVALIYVDFWKNHQICSYDLIERSKTTFGVMPTSYSIPEQQMGICCIMAWGRNYE